MLAVQRPMMGSSKPPHMLFGYDIDTSDSQFPLPSPPPLASGPSLLDDTDTRFLDSFFDGVSSDQYLNDPADSWTYEWNELPPDFLGTTSSFGQQLEPVTNDVQQLTFPEYKNPLGFIPVPEQPAAPRDTINTQQYLHDGQHNAQNNGLLNGHHGSMFFSTPPPPPPPPPPALAPASMGPPSAQNLMASGFQLRRMPKPANVVRHTSMNEAFYGAPYASFSPSQTILKKVEIRWGTDSGFASGRGFVPPPNAMTEDEIDESITNTLECFLPGSNGSTRPSSPSATKTQPFERRLNSITEAKQDEADDRAKMKKRKKSKAKDEDYDDEEENGTTNKNSRKRRPKSLGGNADSDTPQKRRKSSASAAPKMTRENLTEDQKRENHIKSEQKRRTLIKEGFEDLNELVPDLRGGGFSKSAVLLMAADWLEDLIKGNNNLKMQLAQLEAQNGS